MSVSGRGSGYADAEADVSIKELGLLILLYIGPLFSNAFCWEKVMLILKVVAGTTMLFLYRWFLNRHNAAGNYPMLPMLHIYDNSYCT